MYIYSYISCAAYMGQGRYMSDDYTIYSGHTRIICDMDNGYMTIS